MILVESVLQQSSVSVDCNFRYGIGTDTPTIIPNTRRSSFLRKISKLLDQLIQFILSQLCINKLIPKLRGKGLSSINVGQVSKVRGAVNYPSTLMHQWTERFANSFHPPVINLQSFMTLFLVDLFIQQIWGKIFLSIVNQDIKRHGILFDFSIKFNKTGIVIQIQMNKRDFSRI